MGRQPRWNIMLSLALSLSFSGGRGNSECKVSSGWRGKPRKVQTFWNLGLLDRLLDCLPSKDGGGVKGTKIAPRSCSGKHAKGKQASEARLWQAEPPWNIWTFSFTSSKASCENSRHPKDNRPPRGVRPRQTCALPPKCVCACEHATENTSAQTLRVTFSQTHTR